MKRCPSGSSKTAIAVAFLLLGSVGGAAPAAASLLPSMASAGLGIRTGDSGGASQAFVPTVNAGWDLGERLTLMTSAAYLRESDELAAITLRGLPSAGNPGDFFSPGSGTGGRNTAHYVPIGLGLRLYLEQHPGDSRGLFIEAAPTLSAAWLPFAAPIGGHDMQWLRGVRAGVGVRIAAPDGARGEIGATYYRMEAARTATDLRTYTGPYPSGRDFHPEMFSVYVAFGFGD